MAATSLLHRPAVRASAAAAGVVLVLVVALALLDPSGGLLAPVGGHGLPVVGTGGVYRWAPLVVGLPVLLVATAAPVYAARAAAAGPSWSPGWRPSAPSRWPPPRPGSSRRCRWSVRTSRSGRRCSSPSPPAAGRAPRASWSGPLVAAAAALAHRSRAARGRRRRAPATRDRARRSRSLLVVSRARRGRASRRPCGAAGRSATRSTVRWSRRPPPRACWARWSGIVVFVGAFALVVRRLAGQACVAAVWVAAIVAGLALGVVGAVVAAGTSGLADAGPDSWWIATTLISLATGIGYGVAVGLVATAATAIAWRWRDRLPQRAAPAVAARRRRGRGRAPARGPRSGRRRRPSAGPQAVAPVAPTGGMERLHGPARAGTGRAAGHRRRDRPAGDPARRQRQPAHRLLPARPRGPRDAAARPTTTSPASPRWASTSSGSACPGPGWSPPAASSTRTTSTQVARRGRVREGARPLHRARPAPGRLGQRPGAARAAVRRRHVADHRLGRRARVGDDHRRHPALPVPGPGPRARGGDRVRQLLHGPRRHPDRARGDVGEGRGRRSPTSPPWPGTTCSTSPASARTRRPAPACCSGATTTRRSPRSAPPRRTPTGSTTWRSSSRASCGRGSRST